MIKPILKRGHPMLREVSKEIRSVSPPQELIADLWDTLTAIQGIYDFTRGSGLAAPQIGELLRASAVEYAGERYTLLNPAVIDHSEETQIIREGCLSFFDFRGMVMRYAEVRVQAVDENNHPLTLDANGEFASLLQHEVDHLDGVLYYQRLAPGESLIREPGMPHIP